MFFKNIMFFRKGKNSRGLKRESEHQEREPAATAPGTQIHYDPYLIEKLKGDHQILLGIYNDIQKALDAENFTLVEERLLDFKKGLTDHLLVENVRLYIYLEHMFSSDETNRALIREFRSEMNQIARTVTNFLMRYEKIGVDPDLASVFRADLGGIGEALVSRIEREESILYPLYMRNY